MLSDDEKRRRIEMAGEHCPVCNQGYSIFPSENPPTWEVNSRCGHLVKTSGQGATYQARQVLNEPSSWRWDD